MSLGTRLFTMGFMLMAGVAAAGCAKTVYVRVPAVCPRDSECLAVSDAKVSKEEADAREAEFIRRAVQSTVEVHGIRYNTVNGKSVTDGVGTIIGAKGYILTSFRLIDRAEVITVTLHIPTKDGRYSPSREISAYPLVSSVGADVALLVLSSSQTMPPPLTIRNGPLIAGDPVWFLGEHGPLAVGRVVETGITEHTVQELADVQLITKSADTGAPLLNACGEVVAVGLGPTGKNGLLRVLPIDQALRLLNITRSDLR